MCKLEEEMQQARKEFAAEKQKLTEELVCTYLYCILLYMNGLSYRMRRSQNIRLKWMKIGR